MVAVSQTSHLQPGYKQTDVGVIPDEWVVDTLGSCLLSPPQYGINAPAVPYSESLPTYIRITDITDDGRFSPESIASVQATGVEKYVLKPGDLVFARTGASVGKSYLYRPGDGPLVFAGYLIRVRPNPAKLLPDYLAYYLQTARYWNWVQAMSMRSGQPGINGNEYAQLLVPLPSPSEQRVIVGTLSDIEELLTSLGELIGKKRNIRQATMQQLLTGKKRLPRFSGVWTATTLGEIGEFSKGRGIKKDDVQPDGIPCIRYGEIYTHHSDVIKDYYSFISREVAKRSQRLHKGDLLFAGSGETAEEIGKCVAFLGNEEVYAGGDIVIFSPTNQDSRFLGYIMNYESITSQKAKLGQGDAVVHISAQNLSQLQCQLPPPDEQTAIATVLSDMDAEIAALEQRREKTRAIKQGMMQELLSGRRRLV